MDPVPQRKSRPQFCVPNPNSCQGRASVAIPQDKEGNFVIMTEPVLGVDIAKDNLDAHLILDGRDLRVANDPAGHAFLIRLACETDALVVFEASGGYDRALSAALDAAGVAYRRVNPRQVRDFARACGVLAKTDRVDARVLARFGRVMKGAPDAPVAPDRETLKALVTRRSQLVEDRKRLKTQFHHAARDSIPVVIEEMQASLKNLSRQIKAYDARIHAAQTASPPLHDKARRLKTIPGIGPVVAASFTAFCPELGQLDRRAIAALIGLAPMACDSGAYKGRRRCWGGRKQLRGLLYMAALQAKKKGAFRDLFERLINNGKPFKLAITAVARKILITMNAMIKNRQDYKYA